MHIDLMQGIGAIVSVGGIDMTVQQMVNIVEPHMNFMIGSLLEVNRRCTRYALKKNKR